MQQVGKSNTTRYSVKVYKFSTFLNVIYVQIAILQQKVAIFFTLIIKWGKGVSLHVLLHDT